MTSHTTKEARESTLAYPAIEALALPITKDKQCISPRFWYDIENNIHQTGTMTIALPRRNENLRDSDSRE